MIGNYPWSNSFAPHGLLFRQGLLLTVRLREESEANESQRLVASLKPRRIKRPTSFTLGIGP